MKARAEFVREQPVHAAMSIHRSETFECWTDDQYLEVRFRSFRHAVHVALIFDHEMRGFEPLGKLFLNSFLAGHVASLPRSPMPRESVHLSLLERLSPVRFVRYNHAHESPTSRDLRCSRHVHFAARVRRGNDFRRLRSSRTSDHGIDESCGRSVCFDRYQSERAGFVCSQNIVALPAPPGCVR